MVYICVSVSVYENQGSLGTIWSSELIDVFGAQCIIMPFKVYLSVLQMQMQIKEKAIIVYI